MSMLIRNSMTGDERTRDELLALNPGPDYASFREKDENGNYVADNDVVTREIRTDQAFKDSTDINKIVKRHQIRVAQSHVDIYPPEAYAEFDGVDLLEAHGRIERAREIFDKLPSEVRAEFGNNHFAFIGFASDPQNVNRLRELIPAIAEPGSYFPNPVSRGGQGAGAATAPSASAAGASSSPPADPPADPPAPDDGA